MEIFEVGFVEGISDDFDIEVVEVLSGEAVTEVRGYEMRAEGYKHVRYWARMR